MKPYIGICKQCGRDKWIANSREVCTDCVYFNNHGETRKQAHLRKKKEKAKEICKKAKKRSHTVKKAPKTGEKELFFEIWNKRPHICENCGEFLGNAAKAWHFSHIKAKSIAPELRLDKNNIELLCWECHQLWDFGDKEKFYERKNN